MSWRTRRPLPAGAAYLWFRGCWSYLHAVAFTLLLVYQVRDAGLTPFELVVTGTVLEATCFLAEVPTGVVADVYSRRLSVLIGAAVVGVGILVQGLFPAFGPILLGNVIWGVGYTFISGAAEAWITDEVGPDNVQHLFTRYEQLQLALTVVGTLTAGALGLLGLSVPMIIAGGGYVVLAVVMSRLMPETGFTPTPREQRETLRHMRALLADGVRTVRRRPVVRSFVIIAVLTGMSSEVFDRLWTAHILAEFRLPAPLGLDGPTVWFTGFALIGTLVALGANLLAYRVAAARLSVQHPGGLMAALMLVQVAGVVGFALSGLLLVTLVAMWLRTTARSIAAPVHGAWLARNVPSASRATTISLTSQADALGQVVGGPPLGALASRTSIPAALLVSAAVLLPTSALYARLRRRSERNCSTQ